MENLHLFLIVTILCAAFGDVLSQNRGSSRYVPSEDDYDGESTRAQRPAPTRRTSVRRQRPTQPPEPVASEEVPSDYQVRNHGGTTGRRVPYGGSSQQYAPPAPSAPLSADDPPIPEDLPAVPPAAPEGKPTGRRRRPKKRRRPQAAAKEISPDKETSSMDSPEKRKVSMVEFDTDQKRPQSYDNTDGRNNPNAYDSSLGIEDKPSWLSDKENSPGATRTGNTGSSQYYPPQTGTNRLPIDSSETGPLTYPEHTAHVSSQDSPKSRYIPEPEAESPNRGSYVPIISPIRKSEGTSRLPHEEYTGDGNSDNSRYYTPSDRHIPQRSPGHRSPPASIFRPDEATRNSGAQQPHNSRQPISSDRENPEVRLPTTEHGYDKNYNNQPSYSEEKQAADINNHEELNPANRFPSEDKYESNYPTFLNGEISLEEDSHSSTPSRKPEAETHRNAVPSYRTVQPQEPPKAADDDNAATGRRQISRYEPPLQRTGSRYGAEEPKHSSRSRSPAPVQPTEAPTRSRGSNRYQPDSSAETFTRTRGSSRYQKDTAADEPTRTRNSQPQAPSQQTSRSRNTQRYQPEPADDTRTSSRRQPTAEVHSDDSSQSADRSYRQRVSQAEVPSRPQQYNPSPYSNPTSETLEDTRGSNDPVRNTLRSRPQFDAGDNVQPYSPYEESSDEHPDPSPYIPEYQEPRQQDRAEPVNQRASPNREQPERPPSRHSGRRENIDSRNTQRQPRPEYEAPPRPNTRQQPQHQAPPRSESRQAPRQQTRPRHQEPAPTPSHGRSTSTSKFSCPEAYGFFPDRAQCDRYYECRNGTAIDSLCEDGLVFNEISAPKYLRCDTLRDVDCSARPELQEARPTKHCPRRYGLFPHETDCTKFWNCVDGTSTEVQCPPGLTYNDNRATCDWADLVKTSCKTEDLLGFTCPEPSAYDLQDGVYTSYPHPDNCQLHFVCIKGEDGERRPRMLSCNEGLVYNPESKSCTRPDDVRGCEDFYGSRSPAPKRKPAREPVPVPEPEEVEEEEPKPRRRVVQHRRQRN